MEKAVETLDDIMYEEDADIEGAYLLAREVYDAAFYFHSAGMDPDAIIARALIAWREKPSVESALAAVCEVTAEYGKIVEQRRERYVKEQARSAKVRRGEH